MKLSNQLCVSFIILLKLINDSYGLQMKQINITSTSNNNNPISKEENSCEQILRNSTLNTFIELLLGFSLLENQTSQQQTAMTLLFIYSLLENTYQYNNLTNQFLSYSTSNGSNAIIKLKKFCKTCYKLGLVSEEYSESFEIQMKQAFLIINKKKSQNTITYEQAQNFLKGLRKELIKVIQKQALKIFDNQSNADSTSDVALQTKFPIDQGYIFYHYKQLKKLKQLVSESIIKFFISFEDKNKSLEFQNNFFSFILSNEKRFNSTLTYFFQFFDINFDKIIVHDEFIAAYSQWYQSIGAEDDLFNKTVIEEQIQNEQIFQYFNCISPTYYPYQLDYHKQVEPNIQKLYKELKKLHSENVNQTDNQTQSY